MRCSAASIPTSGSTRSAPSHRWRRSAWIRSRSRSIPACPPIRCRSSSPTRRKIPASCASARRPASTRISPASIDVIGGHIDIVFNPKSSLLTHFQEGTLKALAVTSEQRWPELPQVPTMAEAGVTGFPTEVWFGLLAPAGTPPAIITRLNRATNESLASAEVIASLDKLGVQAHGGSPDDFAAALADQARTWRTVIEATGIKME